MSNTDYNTHLYQALTAIDCSGSIDKAGTANSEFPVHVHESKVTFKIQEGPIKECGKNGCDATEIIRYAIGLYRSFNNAHGCRENSLTITHLEEALHWQEARTRDREKRQVEGTNQN